MSEERVNTEEEIDRIPAPFYRPTSANTDIGFFLDSDRKERWEDCQLFKGEWLF